MRVLSFVGAGVAVLVVIYLLVRGQEPNPPAQISARKAVEELTRDRVHALASGDVERWARSFAPYARFVCFDLTAPGCGPDAAAMLARREIGGGPGGGPGPIRVGASRRGRLAWAVAEILPAGGDESGSASPFRLSMAYLKIEDEWRVVLEHHSGVGIETDAVVPPGRGPAETVQDVPGRSRSEDIERPFRKQLERLSDIRMDPEVMIVGPTDGELAFGDTAATQLLADWEIRYGVFHADAGTIQSWSPRNRAVGWVVADVEARPPGAKGVVLKLRFSAVYRARGENAWSLVLAHLSVPVADSAAVRRADSAERTSAIPAPQARSATSAWKTRSAVSSIARVRSPSAHAVTSSAASSPIFLSRRFRSASRRCV
jgi:ketosteroid isomerase-like protein